MRDLSEKTEQQIQVLLAEMNDIISVLRDVAINNEIERIDFLGGQLHFGTDFDGDYQAGTGVVFNTEWWSASTFDCHPTNEMRRWMWGPDPANWRKTSYDEEY